MPKRAAAAEAAPSAKKPKAAAGVLITSSKACQAFKRTTNALEKAIRKRKPDVSIEVDEQKKLSSKPDKGSFVVEVNGKKLVELGAFFAIAGAHWLTHHDAAVAIPRPFTKMKELDLDKLAGEVCALL